MPPPSPRGANAPGVEGGRKSAQVGDAICLKRPNDRQDVGRERIRIFGQRSPSECRGLGCVPPVPEPGALGLPCRECGLRTLRYQPSLFLCQRSIVVQQERVSIRTKLGDDEWHALGHEASNEGHVAGKPIELGHQDRTLLCPPRGQRCGQPRPPFESVGALPGLRLDELGGNGEAFRLREPDNGRPLGLDAETRAALAFGSGRIDEVNRIFSAPPTLPRSRTFARRTATGPIPVWITRSGP